MCPHSKKKPTESLVALGIPLSSVGSEGDPSPYSDLVRQMSRVVFTFLHCINAAT